jgi:NRPS condensation-like uncharacterized protein
MRKYKVELLDEYIRFQEGSNDHQIRAVIAFNFHLNIATLKTAILKSFTLIPILKSKYVNGAGKVYWDYLGNKYEEDQYFHLFEGDSETNLELALRKTPDQYAGPQLYVSVIRQSHNDVLCIVVNHMVFDGSGFKSYLYLLSKLYTNGNTTVNESGKLESINRNVYSILKNIKFTTRLRMLFQKSKTGQIQRNLLIDDDARTSPYLFRFTISSPGYHHLKNYCEVQEISVNDYILTVFYKTLFEVNEYQYNEMLTMTMMIDARRYDFYNILSPFCNASSMKDIQLKFTNQSFDELSKEINTLTRGIKLQYPGVKNLILLKTARSLLPKTVFDSILKNRITSINLSTTNLGIIDHQALDFGDGAIKDAYIVTALKNQPGVQFTFSTFHDQMTISVYGNYSESNINILENVFKKMKEIISLTSQPCV